MVFLFSECPVPTVPEELSSDLITTNYTFEDVISFTCQNESWTLIGQDQITCTESGQWDAPVPICKCKCDISVINNSITVLSTCVSLLLYHRVYVGQTRCLLSNLIVNF